MDTRYCIPNTLYYPDVGGHRSRDSNMGAPCGTHPDHREQNEKADLPHGHHDRYRPSCNNKRLRLTRILVERCPLLVHRGGVVHYRLSAISLGCERGRSLTRLAVWWVALGVDGTVETHLSG